MRATSGYKASQNGIVDEAENSGNSFTDPVGSQAWAGRYSSNTGVTTAEGVIGTLTAGQTVTVSFDAVIDGFNSGTAIYAMLVAFDPGAARNAVEQQNKNTAAVMKLLTGNATSSYQTYTFSYTVGENVVDNNGATSGGGTAWLQSLLGKDIAVRFAHRNGAIVDNVRVTVTGGVATEARMTPGPPVRGPAPCPMSARTSTSTAAASPPASNGRSAATRPMAATTPAIAPTIDNTTDPDFFIFTYRRADEANADSNTAICGGIRQRSRRLDQGGGRTGYRHHTDQQRCG